MFKKCQALSGLGKAIKSVKTNVPKTEIQKKLRDVKIATQKAKAGKAKLDQTIFEMKTGQPFTFKGKKGNSIEIKNEMKKLKIAKDKNQPTKIKTSGSTFKNPISQTDKKVWELIKESVPLDKSFGDACISQKHCNFFINKGKAKSSDIENLIKKVRSKVYEKTKINLELEIKIVGE